MATFHNKSNRFKLIQSIGCLTNLPVLYVMNGMTKKLKFVGKLPPRKTTAQKRQIRENLLWPFQFFQKLS
jgi:hypothetical protein